MKLSIDSNLDQKVTTTHKKKFVKDATWVFSTLILSVGIGALVNIFLGNYLGPEALGFYSLVMNIFSVAILVSGLGVEVAITKYVAEYKMDKLKTNHLISTALLLSFLLGLCAFFILFVFSWVFSSIFNMPEISKFIKIMSFAIPFLLLNDTFLGVLNGLRYMDTYAYITAIRRILYLIFIFILVYYSNLIGVFVAQVLTSIITLFVFLYIFKNIVPNLQFGNFRKNANQLLSFGSKILVSNSIGYLGSRLDVFMIAYFCTQKDLGIYAVSLMFFKLIDLVPASLMKITYPATTEYYYSSNVKPLEKMINTTMLYTFVLLGFFGIIMIFILKDVLTLFFPSRTVFLLAYQPFLILALGKIFFGMRGSVGGCLSGAGRPDIPMKLSIFSLFLNIILNYTFIPLWGISGAALATSISIATITPVTLILFKKILGIDIYFNTYLKTALAIILTLMLTFILTKLFIVYVAVIFGMAFYVIVLNKLKVLSVYKIKNMIKSVRSYR